jgi:hypothetical protein
MAINLKEITDAVKSYLDNKVTVTISGVTPQAGNAVNPNESFTFRVVATNADAANGGVALKNVRYRISVDNPAVVKLKVPPTTSGSATDLGGGALAAGALVGAMIFDPASAAFDLAVGDHDAITVSGVAGSAAAGGNSTIRARVLAEVDLNLLFPKGEDSAAAARAIQVVG